jgi:hypothetical protein
VAGKTGTKGGDEALLQALAAGLSVPDAARASGLSERTAYRRLGRPDFRARVDAARAELVSATVGRLAALGTATAEALAKLLRSRKETVKLGAARVALEYLFKGHEHDTLARQVRELAEELERLRHGDGNPAPGSNPPPPGSAGPAGVGGAAGPAAA